MGKRPKNSLPSLVKVNDEHDVVPEARDSMGCRHGDDEGEYIVDERVEGLVHECPPGQRRHRFQLVVDEQLRQHEEEPEGIHSVDHRVQCPRIPTAITQLTFMNFNLSLSLF